MAFKIYKNNNYIIIEDTVNNKQYQGHSKNVFVYKDELLEDVFDFNGLDDDGIKGISLSDIIKSFHSKRKHLISISGSGKTSILHKKSVLSINSNSKSDKPGRRSFWGGVTLTSRQT